MRLAVALGVASVAWIASAPQASADGGASKLLAARCPHNFVLPLKAPSHRRIQQAVHGTAVILGKRKRLEPPINWHQNPFHSYPYQKKLNELEWLDPLVYADLHGNRRALRRATSVVLDWIRQNPRAEPHRFRTAWERKRAGDRLAIIAIVGRRAACHGLLDRRRAGLIVQSVRVHAAFLFRDASRSQPVTNHTLSRDQGALVAARYYGFLPDSDRWRHVAVHRFEHAIYALVDRRTGVPLEHTPGYEQKTADNVRAFLHLLTRPQPHLKELLRRMKRDVAWFTMPDGDIVPIADTPFYKRAPRYARGVANGLSGLSGFLRDGFAIARKKRSYLATVAGYHRAAHKHADELSFDLFDAGRRVIVDTGRRDHTQLPNQVAKLPGARATAAFTKTSFAHSTLVVDGQSFDLHHRPYGSALDAQGRGAGWFAILGHNPLLRKQGVRHRRLWLYKPGQALVIVDRVSSRRRHTYSRFLQVGPGIHARHGGGYVHLNAKGGFHGSIWSPGAHANLYRAQLHPIRGWYVRGGFNSLTPRFTERLTTKARSARLISTVGLSRRPVRARAAARNRYVIHIPHSRPVQLTVHRHGRRLTVRSRPR